MALIKCPECGKSMTRRKGKNGYFWGCSGYPYCKLTVPDKKGKPDFSAATTQTSDLTAECPKCHGQMHQNKNKYGIFWRCENNDCKLILTDQNNKPVIKPCPTCHKGFLVQRDGKKGKFWSCNRYPDCKTIAKE